MRIASFKNQANKLEITFDYNFEPSTIRGVINLDFFLYLKEVKDTLPYMANTRNDFIL